MDKIGMDSGSHFSKFIKGGGIIAWGIVSFLCLSSLVFSNKITDELIQAKKSTDLLWEIHQEVDGMKRFANGGFVKGEFHINLDGNEENKEEHIVVLNHFASGLEKMLLQVTYFESRRKNSPVKYAKCVREIECSILGGRVEIERCDYNEIEISLLLPGILEGIREEKKILNLIQ